MRKDEVLRILKEHRRELEQYGAKSLAIFGSVARGESTDRSDIDILVEIVDNVGLFEFVRLKNHLEKILGCPVDLVTQEALKKQLRDRILREAIYAA